MNFKLILIVVLACMAVVFVVQNVAVVEIVFLSWRGNLSSALLIFLTMLTGFVLGWFLHGYLLYRKAKREIYLR